MSYGTVIDRAVPRGRGLCRSHPQGREPGRPAGAGADQIRVTINLKTAKALGIAVPPTLLGAPTR